MRSTYTRKLWFTFLYELKGRKVATGPIMSLYCILHGRIKVFNSAIYAIKCQQVVIELWLGSYSTVVE